MRKSVSLDQDTLNGSSALFTQLEERTYLATDDHIKALAVSHLKADRTSKTAKNAYLRSLAAGVQEALGVEPRKAPPRGKRRKLTEEDKKEQLQTIETLHKKYYALVLDAITTTDIVDDPKLEQKERTRRSLERNSRSNFARSAKYVLSKYVEKGGDITTVVIPTLQKSALQEAADAGGDVEDTAERLKARISTSVSKLEKSVSALAEEDEEAAATAVEAAMSKLATLMGQLGRKSTTKPDLAVKHGLMLKTEQGVFYPVTSELRQ